MRNKLSTWHLVVVVRIMIGKKKIVRTFFPIPLVENFDDLLLHCCCLEILPFFTNRWVDKSRTKCISQFIFEKIGLSSFFQSAIHLQGDHRYRIWTRAVDWFRLYDRRRTADRQTDTHTHTQTFFLKHIFRLWEWCRTKNHKKIEVEFFDDCNTCFTPKAAQK